MNNTKNIINEKIWYNSITEPYIIQDMSTLSDVVLGYRKDMRRQGFFRSEEYPDYIFEFKKQYITEKDQWKNEFKNEHMYEYYLDKTADIEDLKSKLKREDKFHVIFTQYEKTPNYTYGSRLVFKGVYVVKETDISKRCVIYELIDSKFELINSIIQCKICNEIYLKGYAIRNHIEKIHTLEEKQYYDKYIKQNDCKCIYCNKPTNFKCIYIGYEKICSDEKCQKLYKKEHNISDKKILINPINDINTNTNTNTTKPTIINQDKDISKNIIKDTISNNIITSKIEIEEKREIVAMQENNTLTTLKTIGKGSECIYLYYYNIYKEKALKNNKVDFECRLCYSNTDDIDSTIKQFSFASPELPIIGLHIKCDDSTTLIKHISYILKMRNKQLNTLSNDWYLTNPTELEEIYTFIFGTK